MDDRGTKPPSRRTHVLRDLAVIVLGGVLAFVLASRIDLAEHVREWIGDRKHLEADELLFAVIGVAAGLAVFSFLRYRDLRREIRARGRTEEALRVGEERYRNLVERVPAVTYVWDSGTEPGDAPAQYMSPQIETLYGFTHEEWQSQPDLWHRRCHPDDIERVLRDWGLAAAAGRPFGCEYRMRAKDGRTVWVRDEAVPVGVGDSGKPLYQGVMFDITERKRTEEALREAEAQYRMLVEQLPAITYRVAADPGGRVIYVSPQIEEIIGFTPDEWTGDPETWSRQLHPDDREWVLAEDRRVIASGEPFSVDYRTHRKDGRVIWVHDESVLVRDDRGQPLFWQGIVLDITAQKQAEQQFREAEQRYRSLVETIPAAIYLEPVDASIATLYVSPQIEAISGYRPERWIEEEGLWPSILHPDDKEAVIEADRLSAATGEPFSMEYRYVRPDGTVVWVRDEAILMHDEDGEPRYWQGFMLDITQRKLAESRLREAEERYRMLVEQLPVVVYIDAVDDLSTALYMSPQYEGLFGYTAEERLAEPGLWTRMLHPEDRERVIEESRRTNETGEPFRAEYRLIAKDGHEVWVRDEAVLVRNEDGTSRFWQGVLLDITERKLAEERLGRRDAILGAVGYAAERFLEAHAWEDGIAQVLERLGRAADVSRAYVFENETNDGLLLQCLRHEWLAPDVPSLGEITDPRLPYRDGFERWEEELAHGRTIRGLTRELPEPERAVLEREQVLSLAVVPVFVGNEWWGFIGFDACQSERRWPQVEIDALRAAADTLGAAIGRERAERRLAEAERGYRTLVEQLPLVTYIEDVGSDLTMYISPQIETLLGYTPEEWLADPQLWYGVLHPDDREWVIAEDRRTTSAGEPLSIEYRFVGRDGRVVWVRDEATLLRDEQGNPASWQGIYQDITARKEAEQRVREAEARYRTLVETIPAITYIDTVSRPWRTLYISPQIESILGYTPDEWKADPDIWSEGVHPGDVERVMAALDLHDIEGEPLAIEYRMRHKDGRWVWLRDEALVVHDAEGRARFSQGVMSDVTEQKEGERQLREAQERFRVLVEHIPAVLYVEPPDVSSPSIYIAPQIEQLFGVSQEEYMASGDIWYRLVHPDDRDDTLRDYEQALAEGRPWSAEYRVVRRDGSTIWVHDEATMLLDEASRPHLVQGVLFDITEQKHAEQALRESEQRERDAADRLRTLDEMKNTFLAAVSHELRSPLTSILGLSLTLERQDMLSAEDRADLLGRLATNARKLDRLLKDLLDIDRLNRGIVTVTQRWADVGALARRTVESLEAVAGRNIVMEADPVSVPCDAAKIERIVENLVVNATRHTTEQTRIWVLVKAHDGGALIVVEDEGAGVPQHLKEAIFEPFQQGPTANPAAPGTGIGLSLVARFAELHGGRAWVEDREGGGASFRVFLPGVMGNGSDGLRVPEARVDTAGG